MAKSQKVNPSKDIEAILAVHSTTAAKIRFLDSQGMPRGDIARKLGIKYQWVRGVLITPVKNPKVVI